MKVKPAVPGAVVRDPHTKEPIHDEGADVPGNSYWNRRLIAGEVVRVDDEPEDDKEPRGDEPVAPLTTRAKR